MKTFQLVRKLGEGSWAVVYEAVDQRNMKTVAVKVIPKYHLEETPILNTLLKNEVKILK